jgi:hypothetical protein
MTPDELLRRLRDPEDNFVERKVEAVTSADIRKTVCAFANTVEGREAVLFIGIHDKTGDILGVTNVERLQIRVREACMESCYPPIKHVSEVVEAEGKRVVAVVVPPSEKKPHFTGPAFIRVGASSMNASEEQLDELVSSRLDKCREILRHKNKGLVTVRTVGYKLGSKKPMSDVHYVSGTECLIRQCTAHLVTLEEPATGCTHSESLNGIVVGFDDEKRRLMLLIRFPQP